jgi:transcriptional regulator with XRE-family HTH domain
MTVGERIQFYRKQNGLSQEELARMLIVSRQTVSLWENGQTLPTIDNLIRLRDIFGISVDEMLVGEPIAESEADMEYTAQNGARAEVILSEGEQSQPPSVSDCSSIRTCARRRVLAVALGAAALIALAAIIIALLIPPSSMRAAERAIGRDLPRAEFIQTVCRGQSLPQGEIRYISELYFKNGMRAELEAALFGTDEWVDSCDWLSLVLADTASVALSDMLLVFCNTTGEYNTRAEARATYTVVCYFADESMLRIFYFEA